MPASELPLSSTPLYSARPTLRLDGQADERLDALLVALRMEESEGGQSALELHFSDQVGTTDGGVEAGFGSDSALRPGALLTLGAGDALAPTELFRGRISALESRRRFGRPPLLVVLAEDALARARCARRSHVHTDCSPADALRRTASALGLGLDVQGLDAPVGTWVQLDETDLAFMRRLAARFDADLQVIGEQLQIAPRGDIRRGTVELQLDSQLGELRVTADLAAQVSAVTIAGWDAAQGSAVLGEADTLLHAGPGRGRSGPDWATEIHGRRSEHLATPAVTSAGEARAVAQAAFDQRARRFVQAHGSAEGNPLLRVGTEVRLSGISPRFDNVYQIVQACHLYDQQDGYRTEFRAECAFLGP